jgi:hypothetical protein
MKRIKVSTALELDGYRTSGSVYGILCGEDVNGATEFALIVLSVSDDDDFIIQKQVFSIDGNVSEYNRTFTSGAFSPWIKGDNNGMFIVNNVTELEAAVALQAAGQFIYLKEGEYVLTEELTPPAAADGGGLIGLGNVSIVGATAADSAIHLIAYAAGTFEYTLGGSMEVGGGTDKVGLSITNAGVSQKIIVYINDDVHFIDNGTGVALSAVNTGTGAMRIYASCNLGTGWDTVNITDKNADDKWHFRGISFDTTINVTDAAVADNWWFESCKVPLAADVTGGNATEVVNIVNCYTMTGAAVTAVNATTDFPDFNPTVV